LHDHLRYNLALQDGRHSHSQLSLEAVMTDQDKPLDFEASLTQLETLVEKLENSEFTLEQSLQAFESGVKLTRQCQQALSQAEQKVQLLIEENGQSQATAFQGDVD